MSESEKKRERLCLSESVLERERDCVYCMREKLCILERERNK